jgi:citrate lyase gamma subunit
MDSNFGEELGYASLRLTMLDTLKQIGGPEAQGAMVHVLQTTADPNEILQVAKDLESDAPGQYRDQILQAARETMDMAVRNQSGTDADRGALNRIFETYGVAYTPPSAAAP